MKENNTKEEQLILENNGDDVMIFGMQLGDICLH
jgi:hypothetical protein